MIFKVKCNGQCLEVEAVSAIEAIIKIIELNSCLENGAEFNINSGDDNKYLYKRA